MSRYILGITGASGSIYGTRLLEELLKKDKEVYLVVTNKGKKVLEYELDISYEKWLESFNKRYKSLIVCDIDDMFSPIASGSFRIDGMVIAPCSMGTLAKLSNGITDNVLIRAGDVNIKEKRNLILVPRETPFNTIHLKNMLTLSKMNVRILPPIPAFYHKPKTLEEIINITIGKILTTLNIENHLYKEWKEINT